MLAPRATTDEKPLLKEEGYKNMKLSFIFYFLVRVLLSLNVCRICIFASVTADFNLKDG